MKTLNTKINGLTIKKKAKPTAEEIRARVEEMLRYCDHMDALMESAKVAVWQMDHTKESRLAVAEELFYQFLAVTSVAASVVDDHLTRFMQETDRLWHSFVGHYRDAAKASQDLGKTKEEIIPSKYWYRAAHADLVRAKIMRGDKQTIRGFMALGWGMAQKYLVTEPTANEKAEGWDEYVIPFRDCVDLETNPFTGEKWEFVA